MRTAFDDALPFVLAREGCDLAHGDTGYVNDALDPGGVTNYGVTQGTYDDWRHHEGLPPKPVRQIAYDEVARIYHERYWHAARCDLFADARPRLALVHFDCAVNQGVGQAARCLQRALGVTADGLLGPQTLGAAAGCDESAVVSRYLADRAAVYRTIVERRPTSAKFLAGWLARLRWCARQTGVPIAPVFAGAH